MRKEKYKFYGSLILCFTAGVLLIFSQELLAVVGFTHLDLHLQKLFYGIGEALFIAVILALTVDTFIKYRLTEDIIKDASAFIIAHDLPSSIRNEIKAITMFNIYRNDLEISYFLDKYTDNLVKVETTLRFITTNILDRPTEFKQSISVQKPYEPYDKIKQILEATASNIYLFESPKEITHYAFYENDIEENDDEEEGTRKTWNKKVYIPANDKSKFTAKVCQIFPDVYEDTITMAYPTVGVRIYVHCSESMENMEIFVRFGHRLKDEVEHHARDTWEFNHALLPYQSISIRWKKK